MKPSEKCIALIMEFEGCVLNLYNDATGNATIGFGHLVHLGQVNGRPNEDQFRSGISSQDAGTLLENDVVRVADQVTSIVETSLNQNQFDALVSFAFNEGVGRLKGSTLLKKINAGDYTGAANEFVKWIYAGTEVLQGLVRRRAAERELFVTPVTS